MVNSSLIHRSGSKSPTHIASRSAHKTKITEDNDSINKNDCQNLNSSMANNATLKFDTFVITEDLAEEDLNRPDVPEWYRDELSLDDHDNHYIRGKIEPELEPCQQSLKTQIVWRNVFAMILLHMISVYGLFCTFCYSKWQSIIWACFIGNLSGMGVLAGAHRLWAHRSYKAHWSLRFLLMLAQTMALQNDIYEWVRDHRVHHKYSETDADPHNSRRGFFFAHVGWLLCRKHPAVKAKGSQIDISDVWADPIVRFQRRFYIPLVLLTWGLFPVYVPIYFWDEGLLIAITGNFFRYVVSLHHSWLVNSAAHISGYRFYERLIQPRENYLVTYLTLGEGYHNYHHTFPWDYSASEYGWRDCFNLATLFIDIGAWLGLVWDRRIVSRAVVEKRATRTGDSSIIPPLMTEKRKPVSMILENFLGMIISSWSVSLIIILRYLFNV